MRYLKLFESGNWIADLVNQCEWDDSWKDIIVELQDEGFSVHEIKMFHTKGGNPLRDKSSVKNHETIFYQTTTLIFRNSDKNLTISNNFIEVSQIIGEIVSRLSDRYKVSVYFNNTGHSSGQILQLLLIDISKPLNRNLVKHREKILDYEEMIRKSGGPPSYYTNINSLFEFLSREELNPIFGVSSTPCTQPGESVLVTLKSDKYIPTFANIIKNVLRLKHESAMGKFEFRIGKVDNTNILIYKGKRKEELESIV